ncbi:hypothetical protein K438DRAFT_2004628 [Mycena galopus ATCC 62051]|nr:hypothetical protein K438DRAFT_2004628 [Mycena galopus ATCC 62051]
MLSGMDLRIQYVRKVVGGVPFNIGSLDPWNEEFWIFSAAIGLSFPTRLPEYGGEEYIRVKIEDEIQRPPYDPPAACSRKDSYSRCHRLDRVWRRWSSGFFRVSFDRLLRTVAFNLAAAFSLRPRATTWIGDGGLSVRLKRNISDIGSVVVHAACWSDGIVAAADMWDHDVPPCGRAK